MKKVYQSPNAFVLNITGKSFISSSIEVGGTVDDEEDIGFVKEEQSGSDLNKSIWDNEW